MQSHCWTSHTRRLLTPTTPAESRFDAMVAEGVAYFDRREVDMCDALSPWWWRGW